MKQILRITFSLLVACHASLCLAGVPRVALMPSGDAKATAIVDLMEVKLAQRDDLVLLDRANVGRILGEQKLVLEGLLSADDAFAIGQLLGCDVFGELHFQAGGDGASAVAVLTAFDAVTGVRLCDATLDASGSLQAISETAGKLMLEALQKRFDAVSRTNVRAVTLLSVRNVDLPPGQAQLTEALGPMLERQLLRSEGITVLERKRLKLVNQEAALTEDQRERLLASSVLLDLDLSRGTTADELSVRGVVSDNAGKEIAVITLDNDGADVQGLVAALAQRLLDILELPAVMASGNTGKLEADRFAAESRRLLRRKHLEEALVAAECAHALSPTDVTIQAMLCGVLESVAERHSQNQEFESTLVILERTWSFRKQWLELGDLRLAPHPQSSLQSILGQKQRLSAEQQERLLQIRRLYRQRWLSNPHRQVRYVELWAETPEAWMDTLLAYSKGIPEELTSEMKFHPLVFTLSKEKKQQLMALNAQRAQNGDPRGFVECMLLAHYMPDVFPDSEERINRNLDQLVDMAINDKSGTGLLMYVSSKVLLSSTKLPASVIRPAMLRLQNEANQRKVVSASIIKYFATPYWGGSVAAFKTAAQNILSGYVPTTNAYINTVFDFDYSVGYPTEPDCFVAWCKAEYERGAKQELVLDGLRPAVKTPHWAQQQIIFELSWAAKRHSIIRGAAQDDGLVFLAVYRRGQNAQTTLHEFDLASGVQRVVSTLGGGVEPNYVRPGSLMKDARVDQGRMSVGERAVYLPGLDGLIIFPRNGDFPHLLRSGEDLPDAAVISAIEIGDSLYLACEKRGIAEGSHYPVRGMLLKCDLNGKNQIVLASSERKEMLSPLDNTDPYFIKGFLHDKENGHLYFMVNGSWDSRNRGIWKLDLKSGMITCSMEFAPLGGFSSDFAPQNDGTIWLQSPGGIASWNPRNNKLSNLNGTRMADPATCAAIVNGVLYARGIGPRSKYGLLCFAKLSEFAQQEIQEPFAEHPPFFLQEWQNMLVAADRYSLWLLKQNTKRP